MAMRTGIEDDWTIHVTNTEEAIKNHPDSLFSATICEGLWSNDGSKC